MTDQHENPAPSSCSASSVEKGSAPAEPAVSPDPSTWRLFVSKANPPASLWIVFWKGFFFYWGASQGPISVEVKHRLFREEQLPSAQAARYEELRQIFLFDRGFAALPEQFDCFLSVLELEGIGSKAPDGMPFSSDHELCHFSPRSFPLRRSVPQYDRESLCQYIASVIGESPSFRQALSTMWAESFQVMISKNSPIIDKFIISRWLGLLRITPSQENIGNGDVIANAAKQLTILGRLSDCYFKQISDYIIPALSAPLSCSSLQKFLPQPVSDFGLGDVFIRRSPELRILLVVP